MEPPVSPVDRAGMPAGMILQEIRVRSEGRTVHRASESEGRESVTRDDHTAHTRACRIDHTRSSCVVSAAVSRSSGAALTSTVYARLGVCTVLLS